MSREEGASAGVLASLRQLAYTGVEIVHTRIELLAAEIDEERARVAGALWLIQLQETNQA